MNRSTIKVIVTAACLGSCAFTATRLMPCENLGAAIWRALGFGLNSACPDIANASPESWGRSLSQSIRPAARNRHDLRFAEGRPARIIVVGDHESDLDLQIIDPTGQTIASDTRKGDTCAAMWVPRQSGTYTITVRNKGPVENNYTLFAN